MQFPFHVTCESPEMRLYELDDGRFQMLDSGSNPPLLFGYHYLLVEEKLGAYLSELGIERVRFEPAVLFNRGTGEEFRTHVRIYVSQFFTVEQLNDLPLDGLRFLTLEDRDYFVSPELKLKLENSPFRYLRFTEGLTGFAANVA